MAHEMPRIDPRLWDAFMHVATQQKKKPQVLLAKLIRDYLQIQEDQVLFAEMRRDLHGREMSDAEAVAFVREHRNGKRAIRPARKT